MVSKGNEDLSSYGLHDLRKEVEGKIETTSNKIDKCVPFQTFMWIVGGLVVIALAVFGTLYTQMNSLNDKISTLTTRITVMDEKIKMSRQP